MNEKTLRERCGQVGRTGEVKLLFQLCLSHPFHLAVENRVPALIVNIPPNKKQKKKGFVSIQQQKSPPPKKTTINTVLFTVCSSPLTVCVRWRQCPCMLSKWRATSWGASSSVHWPIGHFQTVAVSFRAAKKKISKKEKKKKNRKIEKRPSISLSCTFKHPG